MTAVGYELNNELAEGLKLTYDKIYTTGDAKPPRCVLDVASEGFEVANQNIYDSNGGMNCPSFAIPPKESNIMKKMHRVQLTLLCFVGVGAVFGGLLAISDPYGSLYGMPTELLRKGPFTSFLVPGIFLLVVIGLGHLIAFIFLKKNIWFHPYLSGIAGAILMIWIVIQCYMLQSVVMLHVLFFIIGIVECVLSAFILMKKNLFPFPQIMQLINGSKA